MDRSLPSPSVLLHDPVLTEMGPGMGDPGSNTSAGDSGVFLLEFHDKYLLLPSCLVPQLAESGQGTSLQVQGFGVWS